MSTSARIWPFRSSWDIPKHETYISNVYPFCVEVFWEETEIIFVVSKISPSPDRTSSLNHSPAETYDALISHMQYNDCWWPCDAKSHSNNFHGINSFLSEYSRQQNG